MTRLSVKSCCRTLMLTGPVRLTTVDPRLARVHMLNGSALMWTSRQQRCVSLSTAAAEYVALSEAGRDVLWLIASVAWRTWHAPRKPHSPDGGQ